MITVDRQSAEFKMVEEFRRNLTIGISSEAIKEAGLGLLKWTEMHRINLTPDRRFDMKTHFFLADIYNEEAPVRVIYKSSQMGASEYAISYSFWCCDIRNATVLYVFPTEGHVTDFSTARIGPAIEASDYLVRIVTPRTIHGRRGADRVKLKRVRNRFMYFRGSQVKKDGKAPQLRAIDADVLVLDEIDEMDPRAPAIAEKRTGHSLIDEKLWISTPTYSGWGIHAQWVKSDKREWFIPCPRCSKKQVMDIDMVVTEWDNLNRPVHWHGYPNDAFVRCKYCGRKLNRNAHGEWVAEYPSLSKDIAGFHLTKFFSPICNLFSIVEGLQSTDESKRKEIFNQDLGVPYEPLGAKMTFQVLDDVRREYIHNPIHGEKTVMGVDVGTLLYFVIRGPENIETGERPQRYAGTATEFEELTYFIKRYNVKLCVIDAQPETRKAREFQQANKNIVWVAYYVGERAGIKIMEPMKWNKDDLRVDIDRTRLIDATFSRFYDKINTLPINIRDLPEYYDQIIAPVRVIENNIARYMEGTRADHYAHAETYCTVASMGIPIEPASETIEYDLDIYKTTRRDSLVSRLGSTSRKRRV